MADRVKKKPAPLSSNAIQLRISGLDVFGMAAGNRRHFFAATPFFANCFKL
jgi:hypothetical protein